MLRNSQKLIHIHCIYSELIEGDSPYINLQSPSINSDVFECYLQRFCVSLYTLGKEWCKCIFTTKPWTQK